MFVFPFLSSFTLYVRLYVHPHLYKWPSFVPFYGCVIVSCIYVPYLLYPVFVDGHLGRFLVLAVVNSAAVNIGAIRRLLDHSLS